jgi:hypothetical protein
MRILLSFFKLCDRCAFPYSCLLPLGKGGTGRSRRITWWSRCNTSARPPERYVRAGVTQSRKNAGPNSSNIVCYITKTKNIGDNIKR